MMRKQDSPAVQDGDSSDCRPLRRRRLVSCVIALSLVVCGALAFLCWPRLESARDGADSSRPESSANGGTLTKDALTNPHGYLGPDACAACHAERVEEFRATRHYLACVVPSAGHMPEGFQPGKGSFHPNGASVRFEMTEANGKFLQTAIRSTPAGEVRSTAMIDLERPTRDGKRRRRTPLAALNQPVEKYSGRFRPSLLDDSNGLERPSCIFNRQLFPSSCLASSTRRRLNTIFFELKLQKRDFQAEAWK